MSAVATATCKCVTFDPKDTGVRLCVEHHLYFRGGKRLASVSSVIKSTWPIPPDYSKADPEVLENARVRGVVVDSLLSSYIAGTLKCIPSGTRTDAKDLFLKAKAWWDKSGQSGQSQVLLADDEIAGTCDMIVGNGFIVDLKTTYNIEVTYPLQVAAYADLYEYTTGMECGGIGILHLTARFPEPKWIPLNLDECRKDWRTMRATYEMVQRRTNGKL